MDKCHIALTEQEKAAIARIDLSAWQSNRDKEHAAFNANKEPILMFLRSLTKVELDRANELLNIP